MPDGVLGEPYISRAHLIGIHRGQETNDRGRQWFQTIKNFLFLNHNPAVGYGKASNFPKFTAKTPRASRKVGVSRQQIHLGEPGVLAVNPQVRQENPPPWGAGLPEADQRFCGHLSGEIAKSRLLHRLHRQMGRGRARQSAGKFPALRRVKKTISKRPRFPAATMSR